MDVFLSWSGPVSRSVALALRDWLPSVVNAAVPFMSETDIPSGGRWSPEVAARLERSNFGIICVTNENQGQPWINFEAGALSKLAKEARVCCYLIDLEPAALKRPLGEFMARSADREGTWKIVSELNQLVTPRNPSVEKSFAKWWPDLEAALTDARGATGAVAAKPTELEMLTEVFDWVRAQKRREHAEARSGSEYWSALVNSTDARTRAAAHIILQNAAQNVFDRLSAGGFKSVAMTTDDDGNTRVTAADEPTKPT